MKKETKTMKAMTSAVVAAIAMIGFATGAFAGGGCGAGQHADPGGRDGTVAEISKPATQTQIATESEK